ncbi:MAG TPA: type I-E CRISPR-associated protein Cas7/Cse4/CasC [Deltaproteobacteria bacterium]|nr:type I-E CRISPR-associated protein Cas7/Cse4/CasC [Deltaproteobacteria bacterium]
MKHLEMHILQSVPVTCLNRDDLGSPKTAFFGGVQRARVSSQSWKRAIREYAHEISPYFEGKRSRLIIDPLKDEFVKLGKDEELSLKWAKEIAGSIATLDSGNEKKVKTIYFTTHAELEFLAKAYALICQEQGDIPVDDKKYKEKAKKRTRAATKEIDSVIYKDAADISLFGRMVASDHSLTIEGAAMFNHPISTHKVDNELDFFAAVDEWQKEDDSGAGMTGTLEFNSSVYYRFAALNLSMLADKEHLACMTQDERRKVVSAFVQATLEAVPGMTATNSGRKNSMNGYTRPSYVLGIVREKGHPIQFVNAFEEPVWAGAGRGIMKESIGRLQKEEMKQNETWKLDRHELARSVIPENNIDEFIEEMVKYVE